MQVDAHPFLQWRPERMVHRRLVGWALHQRAHQDGRKVVERQDGRQEEVHKQLLDNQGGSAQPMGVEQPMAPPTALEQHTEAAAASTTVLALHTAALQLTEEEAPQARWVTLLPIPTLPSLSRITPIVTPIVTSPPREGTNK